MDIENELKHWGILGMKWGVRRYQNEDGSLTPEGRERYLKKAREDITKENSDHKVHSKAVDEFNSQISRINSENEGKNKNAEDWDKTYDKEWKQIYGDLLKKEYGEIANKIYDNEQKWLEQFDAYHMFEHEPINSSSKSSIIDKKDAVKNFTKNYKDSYEDKLWGMDINELIDSFNRAEPAEDKDLDVNVKELMKIFGLSKEDLVVDNSDGYPRIYKKDGTAFVYRTYPGRDIEKQLEFQDLADEGDWPNNLKFTVYDNKGNPRNDIKEKYIEDFIYKDPEFYMIKNPKSEHYGQYSYKGNKFYDSISDLVADVKEDILNNNEVKHSGILGMKWGVRRYQNPDGSLTLLGRLHYGVGPERKKVVGVNDISALSDDELRKMSKRYQNQANYYRARNDYIQQEQYYKQMTAPKKKEHRFLNNVFIRPLESFMAKNAEFAYGALGYAVLGGSDSDFATQYFNAITNSHLQTKEKKDPEKEEYKKEYEKLERERNLAQIKNEIKGEEWKRDNDQPFYNGNPKSLINQSAKNNAKPTKGDKSDIKITPFDSAEYFEPVRKREAELFQTKFSDLLSDTTKVPTEAELQLLQNELDAHLTTPTYKYGKKIY